MTGVRPLPTLRLRLRLQLRLSVGTFRGPGRPRAPRLGVQEAAAVPGGQRGENQGGQGEDKERNQPWADLCG